MRFFSTGRQVWDVAFEEFAVQRAGPHLRTAVFLTGDRQAAEDLLQTALVRTALRWRQAKQNPDAYLRQVLVNLVRDNWRAGRRRAPELSLEAATDDTGGAAFQDRFSVPSSEAALDDRDELLAALRQLPARQRTAVVLRFWEDLSVAETAVLMGCTEGTVKSATSRGLDRLRIVLTALPAGESTHSELIPRGKR
jgi:RNA polymerase sigma-70 factor (sigma-E family)